MGRHNLDFPDPGLQTVLGNTNMIDGIPLPREIGAEARTAINEALAGFRDVVGADSDCIVIAGYLGYLSRDRARSTEDEVLDRCTEHFKAYPTDPVDKTIHLVLDSRGGSLDSAYKAVLYLRRFAKSVRVYVPRRAKSAATLIAVGADEICMSPFAELGPLDTQIRDPRNPTKDISALDCYQSVDYVREFGLQTLPAALGLLLSETQARIPLAELINTATTFALGGVTPILSGVKALDFGGWGRTLKIGETYARALLRRLPGEDPEGAAQRIAKRLVYGYPHHPYPIDIDEADLIGLNTSMMSEAEYAAALKVVRACEDYRVVAFANGLVATEPGEATDARRGRHGDEFGTPAPRSNGHEEAARAVENPVPSQGDDLR